MPFRNPLARRHRADRPTLRQRLDALKVRLHARRLASAVACPVERIGRKLAELQARHLACDETIVRPGAPAEGSSDMEALRWEFDRLQDAIDAAMDEAGEHQATDLGGVMLNVLLLGRVAREVGDSVHEPADLAALCASADRHLMSALICLSRLSGVRPEEVGGDYLLTGPEKRRIADALGETRATEFVGLVATASQGSLPLDPAFASVEAQLADLNRQADAWVDLYTRTGDVPQGQAECAAEHSVRVLRRLTLDGLGLPATTSRELALQARLASWHVSEWWDDNTEQDGELACRALLARLMGLGGVARLAGRDFTVAEIEATIGEPDPRTRARAAG